MANGLLVRLDEHSPSNVQVRFQTCTYLGEMAIPGALQRFPSDDD